jgi:hypothetical protein
VHAHNACIKSIRNVMQCNAIMFMQSKQNIYCMIYITS